MAKESAGKVSVDLELNDKQYNKQLKSNLKGTENAFSNVIGKVGGLIAGAFTTIGVTKFTKNCIDSASKIQSAFTGLNSIVQGTGNSFSQVQKFVEEYTKDGLVSIGETAKAYKNLLARGYDTSQIENVMTRLKDSAAFGRQASYDLGEAIVTATEGLKNENSILVDNAGVTKNVVKMWEEWAKAHGTSTAAMTQEQKIQAEYNGIMQETRFQVGDAAIYTKTFSGQVQQLKFNFNQMTTAIGKVVTPLAQLFIPIINVAINAVTKFFTTIQGVLKAFGLEMPDVVSKSSSSMAELGANAFDTAGDISSTGTAAKKAAKEVNKAFAGVDEINVLNTKKDTSSSAESGGMASGGASTGVSTEIVPTVASDSAISSAIQGTIDKIMKFIQPLKEINFDNLTNAFGNLWNAIKPFGEKIGSGLEWLYFNVLVPLAKWTIENILPDFLNAFAGALKVLDPIVDGVGEALKWLWDNFLEPIAGWVGSAIDTTLKAIGDALNWIGENEDCVAILENIGKVIGIIAAAIGIYNGAMAVCNAVTGIFSGITSFLGNGTAGPIALVGIAITALIAIITLLIKHWDDVKEAASKCWDWIKSVWDKVASWFNDTIIEPVKNFFSGMWDKLKNGASQAWEGIKGVFGGVADWFRDIFSKAWEKVKNVFSTGGKIFDGIKDGIANVFKTVVNGIIGGINKVIAVPFNTINGMLNKIKNLSFLGISPFKNLWKQNPLPVPQIPKLAQGGYVPRNEPQLAIVGDNTREGEIVTPESKMYEQVVRAIKDSGNVGKQEIEIHLYHHYEDGRTIIQKINQEQINAGEILLMT